MNNTHNHAPISTSWTPEERLDLIRAINLDRRAFKIEHHESAELIHFLCVMPAGFLETNRDKYRRWIAG